MEYRWTNWTVPVLNGAYYKSSILHLVSDDDNRTLCGRKVSENAVMGMGSVDEVCAKCKNHKG